MGRKLAAPGSASVRLSPSQVGKIRGREDTVSGFLMSELCPNIESLVSNSLQTGRLSKQWGRPHQP